MFCVYGGYLGMLVAIGSLAVITVPPWELALPRQVVLKARGHVVAILGPPSPAWLG